MWFLVAFIIAVPLTGCLVLYIYCKRLKQQITYLKRLFATVENSKDILYYCELPKLKYRYLSSAINQLGKNAHADHQKNPGKFFEVVHPDDQEKVIKKMEGKMDFNKPITLRLRNDKGKYVWFEEYANPVYKEGRLVAVQGFYRNIDEKMKLMQKLKYDAFHDGLTNTYNRSYFQKKLDYFQHTRDVSMGVIICDLDHLKYINDHYGHQIGDRAIVEASRLLANCIDHQDAILARIGGDEFAILLPGIDENGVVMVIDQVNDQVMNYNKSNELQIEISFGYAYAQASIGNMENLYNEADQNMYLAKNAKKELAIGVKETFSIG